MSGGWKVGSIGASPKGRARAGPPPASPDLVQGALRADRWTGWLSDNTGCKQAPHSPPLGNEGPLPSPASPSLSWLVASLGQLRAGLVQAIRAKGSPTGCRRCPKGMTPELQIAHHQPVSQEEEDAEAQRLHSFPRSHRTGAGWDPTPSRPSLGSGCGAGWWQPGGQSPFWGSGLWSPSLPLLPGQAQSQGLGEFRKPSSGLCSPAAQSPSPQRACRGGKGQLV